MRSRFHEVGAELGNIPPLAICLAGISVHASEQLRRVLGHLKRALRKEQRPTVEELLQLSEAIIDYGRMIHAHHHYSGSEVIVEIPELSHRFRETPQTIEDALRRLREIGRAEPGDLDGCWKLQLAGPLLSGRDGPSLGDAPLPHIDRKNR